MLKKYNVYTVKPAHVATSIKQSPVLKGHLFLVQSLKISNELNLFKRSPVLKDHFFLSQGWPLNTGLTVLYNSCLFNAYFTVKWIDNGRIPVLLVIACLGGPT